MTVSRMFRYLFYINIKKTGLDEDMVLFSEDGNYL